MARQEPVGVPLARIAQPPRRRLDAGLVLPVLTTGVIVGVLESVIATSFAALIFAGRLTGQLGTGIGIMLVAAVVLLLVTGLLATEPGTIGSIQDVSSAVLALIAAGAAAASASRGTDFVSTAFVAVGLSTLFTGALLLLLGSLRVGDLVRFVPYPVIGGFLAASGWLVVKGSVAIMADVPLSLTTLDDLVRPAAMARWGPGLALALWLVLAMRRRPHFVLIPASLLVAVVAFYVVLAATGTSPGDASAGGWLLGPLPSGGLWAPRMLKGLGTADWGAIASQAGTIATLLVISLLSLLLNASGVELMADRDVDLNRELRVAGIANVASGATGGAAGYHALSLTALAHHSGARSRLVAVVAAAVCGAVLLLGSSLLSLTPRFVVAGLLLFLGLGFLLEWVVDAWSRLSRPDYLVVIVILLTVAVVGVLPGVATGLAVAVVLFVVNYSRTDVVRHVLSGTTYSSAVERPPRHRDVLRAHGEQIHILQLQGFLFFGTAKVLLDRIVRRLADPDLPRLRFLVLDFSRVTGLDASAVVSFNRTLKFADARAFTLVLTGVTPAMRGRLEQGDLRPGTEERLEVFPDLDAGMEWVEDQTLAGAGEQAQAVSSLWEQLDQGLGPGVDSRRLASYFTRVEVDAGDEVIRQGDVAEDLFFLESGRLTARLRRSEETGLRLRTMGPGTVVGELPLYLGTTRTASVIAEERSVLHRLSLRDFQEMERREPELAAALHRLFARLLAQRLADSLRSMSALLQ